MFCIVLMVAGTGETMGPHCMGDYSFAQYKSIVRPGAALLWKFGIMVVRRTGCSILRFVFWRLDWRLRVSSTNGGIKTE